MCNLHKCFCKHLRMTGDCLKHCLEQHRRTMPGDDGNLRLNKREITVFSDLGGD